MKQRYKNILRNAEQFREGKRGKVRVSYVDGCLYAVKSAKDVHGVVATVRKEHDMNLAANEVGCGPEVVAYVEEEDVLIRRFVEGWGLRTFLRHNASDRSVQRTVFSSLLETCYVLDEAGIRRPELGNPYKDVIVTPSTEVVVIDWERARYAVDPRNVAQFTQFMLRASTASLLGIRVSVEDKKRVASFTQRYMESRSRSAFDELKRVMISFYRA
jgi:predicted Ser/Thr protein kinase